MQFFAVVLAAVAVAACGDENPTVPSIAPQFVLAPGDALVCDFPDANKANRDYYANRSQSQTDVKELLGDMKSAGAGTIDADSIGFEIFKTIEEQTPTGSDVQGGPAEGSELTNQVLACMAPAMTPGDTAVDFTGAFGPSGAFCVRGGSGDIGSECLTYDNLSGLTPNPDPDTTSTKSDWESWFNERRLVYAEPLPTFASAEMVQPVTVSIEGWDWSTLPALPLNHTGVVGICVENQENPHRVQHNQTGPTATILLLFDPTFLPCFNGFAPLSRDPGSPLSRFAKSVLDLAVPRPLFAAATVRGGGTGGGIDDLSDFAVVDAQAVILSFDTQLGDGTTGEILDPIVVLAEGVGFTPFNDLTIRLSVFGNSTSQEGILTGTGCETSTAYPQGSCMTETGTDGLAIFSDIQITKSGGYRLLATTTDLPESSPDASQVVSNNFQVNP
jgi:hypothetical protein